ncbi:hypothetical protein [Streptomyces sp. NBC_00893]|uniref:hypothetical protein n=1 Tax=Streptomyces sp. NBC_00893 TaxID=2975862 RepID=UPI002250686E|nr:hypothetical protein [Streptomyces sp. NBC_00893]MCX4852187.1 hypothetical protein [Streptomyces sp. NBC_00893]
MKSADLTPHEAARWAGRAGLPLPDDRHADVAVTADYIRAVVATLRDLDFQDTPPAAVYRAVSEDRHGTV